MSLRTNPPTLQALPTLRSVQTVRVFVTAHSAPPDICLKINDPRMDKWIITSTTAFVVLVDRAPKPIVRAHAGPRTELRLMALTIVGEGTVPYARTSPSCAVVSIHSKVGSRDIGDVTYLLCCIGTCQSLCACEGHRACVDSVSGWS